MERLNKFLSRAGACSRREADRAIEAGEVLVNGRPAELGQQVSPEDVVEYRGRVIRAEDEPVMLALYKPAGIVCTTAQDEPDNIVDFLGWPTRVYPVGRLDKDSEGLIFMTNMGEAVNGILRNRYNKEKEYIVRVDKPVTIDFLTAMRSGVRILDTVTKPCRVEKLSKDQFRIVLTQGLNRQIRRMCEALDYRVRELKRVRIMNVTLDGLAPGEWRKIEGKELEQLLDGGLHD